MEHYFTAQRDNIFRNVEVLIYVFDVESREIDKDIHYYQSWYSNSLLVNSIENYKFIFSLESISQQSPNARIYVLIHKMDLIPDGQREAVRILLLISKIKNYIKLTRYTNDVLKN